MACEQSIHAVLPACPILRIIRTGGGQVAIAH